MMSAKLQSAEDFLRQQLAEGPQAISRLIAEAPVSRRTVFRAARQLGVVRLPGPGGAKVKYWALPQLPADEGLSGSAPVEKVPALAASAEPAPIVAKEPRLVEADLRPPIAEEETDPRVRRAAQEVRERIRAGMNRDYAVYEVCKGDVAFMRRVQAELNGG